MELYFLNSHVIPILGPVEDFLTLTYTDRFDQTGEFSFTLPLSSADKLKDAAYVELRGDGAPTPFTDGKTTLGRIQKTVYSSEHQTVTVSGKLAESLLAERFIARGTHVQGSVKQVIEHVLTYNAIGIHASARAIPHLRLPFGGVPDFRDETGNLILLDLHLGGNEIEHWLRTLLKKYGASYRITYDETDPDFPLAFSVYFPKDRTHAQTTNPPVIFSTSLATLAHATFTHDTENYRNYALIAGEGNGGDRVILTLDRRKTTDEPLREVYIDARDLRSDDSGTQMSDESYQKALLARAEERLDNRYAELTRIEGEGSPTFTVPLIATSHGQITHRAGRDFSIGDRCDLALDTPKLELCERVTALKTELKDGNATTTAIFGAEYPSMTELLEEAVSRQ